MWYMACMGERESSGNGIIFIGWSFSGDTMVEPESAVHTVNKKHNIHGGKTSSTHIWVINFRSVRVNVVDWAELGLNGVGQTLLNLLFFQWIFLSFFKVQHRRRLYAFLTRRTAQRDWKVCARRVEKVRKSIRDEWAGESTSRYGSLFWEDFSNAFFHRRRIVGDDENLIKKEKKTRACFGCVSSLSLICSSHPYVYCVYLFLCGALAFN